jgi:asparagine synthase (glutamine-hydrolysing)
MCGIAGIWTRDGAADLASLAEATAAALRHRGPDAQTTFVDREAGLAFSQARLSIIDLSPAGAMPMTSADGRFVIAYNGEVYETEPIRADLEALGVRFRGHSDTEVILESCAHFGVEKTLPRLVGMFAFALWDKRERQLVLVRDRFGIKPLYYAELGRKFVFGSELKALFADSEFCGSIDREALASYFRFGYVPAPHSIFCGVKKLMPGHMVVVENATPRVPERWWDLRPLVVAGLTKPAGAAPREAEAQLDRLLRHVVGLRMVADVPLGAFLSGGLDSSMVVAQMQAQSPRPVKTFTIGFIERGYDESEHAEAVARHLGTDHTTLKVTPADAMAVIPNLSEWYDEPFADYSQIPTYLVSRLARSSVTVALSGDGGDELFAGYTRYHWGEVLWGNLARIPLSLRRALAGTLEKVPASAWSLLEGMPRAPRQPQLKARKLAGVLRLACSADLYRRLVSVWPEPSLVVQGTSAAWGVLADDAIEAEITPLVERMQYLDAVTYLPDDILTKLDRASMAVSLEARVPLLDHRVAAFAAALPRALRLTGTTGKVLLRQVLARYLPPALFERPKSGFSIPVGEWIRGPLREWADSLLTVSALKDGGLAPEPIRAAWEEHLAGRVKRDNEIWSVLMYQAWRGRWRHVIAG